MADHPHPQPSAGPSPSPPPEGPHAPATPSSPPPAPPSMESLLPVHPALDANGMASIGCLHVESALYDRFRAAMIYDAKNPETVGVVKHLIDGPLATDVVHTDNRSTSTTPMLHGGATVHWNPDYMLIDGQGGRHSSAVIVGHELNHADHLNHDDFKYDRERTRGTGTPPFTNREDQHVVEGWERRTSAAVGEAIRHDNASGELIMSRGVTSLEPILHQVRNGRLVDVKNLDQSGRIVSVTADTVVQEIRKGESVSYPRNEIAALTTLKEPHVGDHLEVHVHGANVRALETPEHARPDPGLGR